MKSDDNLALVLSLALAIHIPFGGANFYDVIQPHQVPPPGVECLPWDAAGDAVNRQWATPGKIPPNASSFCAQQGNGSESAHHSSAYCIDSATRNLTYCESVTGVPEQINVQIASPDSVIVGYVPISTFPPACASALAPSSLPPDPKSDLTQESTPAEGAAEVGGGWVPVPR